MTTSRGPQISVLLTELNSWKHSLQVREYRFYLIGSSTLGCQLNGSHPSQEFNNSIDEQLACMDQCFERYRNDTDWFIIAVSLAPFLAVAWLPASSVRCMSAA